MISQRGRRPGAAKPDRKAFRSFPPLGRPGEVWGAESAADSLVVVRGA